MGAVTSINLNMDEVNFQWICGLSRIVLVSSVHRIRIKLGLKGARQQGVELETILPLIRSAIVFQLWGLEQWSRSYARSRHQGSRVSDGTLQLMRCSNVDRIIGLLF